MKRVFLTAAWTNLAMLNFEIEPAVLRPLIPVGTELDDWNGKTFISVVGFLFSRTRILGVSVPYHRDFEEVNLRFYVRRKTDDSWRRGVVFIKEIVPRWAIAWVARTGYNEPYIALRMGHSVQAGRVEYYWWLNGTLNTVRVDIASAPREAPDGSEAQFITEHYWGYNRGRSGRTLEYQVQHPRWRICEVQNAKLLCDVETFYGQQFSTFLKQTPSSAFLAEGSDVTVHRPAQL